MFTSPLPVTLMPPDYRRRSVLLSVSRVILVLPHPDFMQSFNVRLCFAHKIIHSQFNLLCMPCKLQDESKFLVILWINQTTQLPSMSEKCTCPSCVVTHASVHRLRSFIHFWIIVNYNISKSEEYCCSVNLLHYWHTQGMLCNPQPPFHLAEVHWA